MGIFALTVVIHKLSRSLKRPLPAAWVKAAKTKVELDPFGRPLKAYYGMLGCLGGLFLCEPTFEPFPQKLSGRRFFAGLAILLSIFLSLEAIEKYLGGHAMGLAVRFIRYGSVPLTILFIAPASFDKLGL